LKKRVYIETSIVSYLTARPSPILVTAAHQQITRDWWARCRPGFDLYGSQLVLDEAGKGNPEAARARLLALRGLPLLDVIPRAIDLGAEIVAHGLVSKEAGTDTLHLAMAVVHRMDALLTWNCRHLANAVILSQISPFVRIRGYQMPAVCTPEELSGDAGESGE
jgi:hypothetical protein